MQDGSPLQTIPARHAVATFVPAGSVIRVVNSSATQVVDLWAFALPKPGREKKEEEEEEEEASGPAAAAAAAATASVPSEEGEKKKKKSSDLPSQEEAEKATKQKKKREEGPEEKQTSWSAYVPSLGLKGKKDKKEGAQQEERTEEQKEDSKTWASYFSAGKGFSSYVPAQASETMASFASMHQRDQSKTYLEQLQDLSKTPVGAAGRSGIAAISGSGYAGSLYAGYQAYNARHAADAAAMEYLSMAHSRAASFHLVPRVDDTLVTNLREPLLTLVEDGSPGAHDATLAACDPARYRSLGVADWTEHRSCAQNLVLALHELNARAGLRGARAVGADVSVNNLPSPLHLFQYVGYDASSGELDLSSSSSTPRNSRSPRRGDFVRFRSERDAVVVLSACPQDAVEGVNVGGPRDAHFVVEPESAAELVRAATAPKKKKPSPVVAKQASAPTKAPVQKQQQQQQQQQTAALPVQKQKDSSAVASAPSRPVRKPIPPPPKTKKAGAGTESSAPAPKKAPRKLVRATQQNGGGTGNGIGNAD